MRRLHKKCCISAQNPEKAGIEHVDLGSGTSIRDGNSNCPISADDPWRPLTTLTTHATETTQPPKFPQVPASPQVPHKSLKNRSYMAESVHGEVLPIHMYMYTVYSSYMCWQDPPNFPQAISKPRCHPQAPSILKVEPKLLNLGRGKGSWSVYLCQCRRKWSFSIGVLRDPPLSTPAGQGEVSEHVSPELGGPRDGLVYFHWRLGIPYSQSRENPRI